MPSVTKTTETTITLSEKDVKDIIADWARMQHGLEVTASNVTLDFTGGYTEYDGYSGSHSHYVAARFNNAVVKKTING